MESKGAASGSDRYSSQLKNNNFTEMGNSSEEGLYLRLIDFCILRSRLESNKGEEEEDLADTAQPAGLGRVLAR